MKVVCVFFGALVAATHGQAYVSYYGQDLHHPVLSKESNSQEEAQLYHKNTESKDDLLTELLVKHYGFDGEHPQGENLPKEELQHHIRKRDIEYQHSPFQKDIHIPVIGKDGVPLDTPEVQRAKEQHFIAHEVVKARQHYPHHGNEEEEAAYYPSVQPKHPHEYVPALGKDGVPVNTPEVQFARKQHFAAIAAVKARQYHDFVVQPKVSEHESFVEHPQYDYEQELQHVGQQGFDYGHYGQEQF